MMSFHGESRGKISMKELFGKKNITKDGKEGKVMPLTIHNFTSQSSPRFSMLFMLCKNFPITFKSAEQQD